MPGVVTVRGQSATVGIIGDDQIKHVVAALNELPKAAAARAQRNTITAILKDFVKVHLAPNIRSGLYTMNARARARYAKSIRVKASVSRRKIVVGKVLVPRTDLPKRNEKFGYLSHIFERGAKPHKVVAFKGAGGVVRNLAGKRRGRKVRMHPGIKAVPIWADTFENQAEAMFEQYAEGIWGAMTVEWQKIKLKGGK